LFIHEPTDEELVLMARSVDKEAFRLLMERYQAMAFSIVLHLVTQPEVAQDLVQEAVLQAYLSLGQLRDRTRFKNWFYGIILNVCRNWWRVQQRLPLSLDLLGSDGSHANGAGYEICADPLEIVEARELRDAVHSAVRALSVANREVMLLFYYEGLHVNEIALRLNLSQVAVKSRLHKGRNQLKNQLTGIYPELMFTSSRKRTSKQRSMTMTNVRIVKVQVVAYRVLIILLDQQGQRVLPIWLNPMEGQSLILRYKLKVQPQGPVEPSPIDFTTNVLRAMGGTVQAVRIEELQQHALYARVFLHGINGDQEIEARLGDALALAEQEGSIIVVADDVLERLGVSLPATDGKLLDQRLNEVVSVLEVKGANPPAAVLPRVKEPQNMQFTQGLQRWDLRGSFLQDAVGTTWEDYICGIDEIVPQSTAPGVKSGYLKAQVPDPKGFADLRQAILRGSKAQNVT
jgi:RNA polymerase sigma factor (sigma-70 family)